jgi:ketosteroid isomerase-like protein
MYKKYLLLIVGALATNLTFADPLVVNYKDSKIIYDGELPINKDDLITQAKLIDIADRRFENKWRNKNAVGIANEYTEYGVFMKPGETPKIGKAAIAKEFEKSVKGVDRVEFFQDELEFFDGLTSAYQRAHMLGYVDSANMPIFKGSYIILWKKVNDQWLIHYDMFNADEQYENSSIRYSGDDKVSRETLLQEAAKIDIADRRFEAKWKAKDYVGISEEYTHDGIFLKPGVPPRVGRKQIAKEFKNSVQSVDHVEFFQDELEFLPGMKSAFQRAHMTAYVAGRDHPVFFGSYTILWKKVNEDWLIQYDMFNADK